MNQPDNSFKNPWEECPEVWPTKAKFFAWLRGGLRKSVWSLYPPKLIFKNSQCTKPPPNYKGKARSGAICALTGEWAGKSALEVDHIIGEASLKNWDDVLPFIQHLCTSLDNMQLVSKEAHRIKTYAQRYGMSFEEAVLEKKVIAFSKLSPNSQIETLTKAGYSGIIPSTKAKRADLYRTLLKEEIEK